MLQRKTRLSALVIVLLVAGVAAMAAIPGLNWRARIGYLKLTGRLPDVRFADLAAMSAPGSVYAIDRLADTQNPFAVIRNPRQSADDVKRGRAQFLQECSTCHGDRGQGGAAAPSLQAATLKHGRSDWAIYTTIRQGVATTAMPPHEYTRDALWQLVAYVQSLATADSAASAPHDAADGGPAPKTVPFAELAALASAGGDWPTYSGSYSGSRHSTLAQITPGNVALLAPKWLFQLDGADNQKVECTPLVHDGRMYLTGPSGMVAALDAASGELLWRFQAPVASTPAGWAGNINRGVALLGDLLFVGTTDAKLIALRAATGKPVWSVDAADPREHRHISSAPLAIDGLVLVGTSGAFGRGSIAAFDAATGRERWRSYTIPAPGMPDFGTWSGDSWKAGGAPAWMTGSYDAAHDIVYWGVGNPAPDYNTALRQGDNLYSNSLLAFRGQTGELLWHFQFSPGDDHDWDSAQVPILADLRGHGNLPTDVLFANRNGFFYRLDAMSGKFAMATSFVFQNWAQGIDGAGRPLKVRAADNARSGVLTYPSNVGATNWWPSTFDASLGYLFIPALERGQVFFPATPGNDPGPRNFPDSSGLAHHTLIQAIDVTTGAPVWQHRFTARHDKEETAGLLSTAGGLVFGADLTSLVALRATTGQLMWRFNTGGQVSAAPMTYSAGGRQFVAVAAGSSFIAFALPIAR